MDKFWNHVDYLIPEENKVQISSIDADKRIKNVNRALNKLQTS